MDKVHRTKKRIIITKRNKPIAQLIPIEEEKGSLFGKMKGTIHVLGDIISTLYNFMINSLALVDHKIEQEKN